MRIQKPLNIETFYFRVQNNVALLPGFLLDFFST